MLKIQPTTGRQLRVGMIGGGQNSKAGEGNFFGGVHRTSILMDNSRVLTAGALHPDPDVARSEAQRLFFTRGYSDYKTMIAAEAELPADQRIDYLVIVTPNAWHYEPAKLALEAGIPVLLEKPMTTTNEESGDLVETSKKTNTPLRVCYTYTAFPMVMLARELVNDGAIGDSDKFVGVYPQGWLKKRIELIPTAGGHQQAKWRTDPKQSGRSGCGGDIGSHAYEFAPFVAGLHAETVLADLRKFVEGRLLDDDWTLIANLIRNATPDDVKDAKRRVAQGTFSASQITIGGQNDCGFRAVGTKGTLEWYIQEHRFLRYFEDGKPMVMFRLGDDLPKCAELIGKYIRLPGGHPEGFHEAIANHHLSLERQIRRSTGEEVPDAYPLPDGVAGAEGVAVINAAVDSSEQGNFWVQVHI